MKNHSSLLLFLPLFPASWSLGIYSGVFLIKDMIILNCVLRLVFSTGIIFVISLNSGVLRVSPERNTTNPYMAVEPYAIFTEC